MITFHSPEDAELYWERLSENIGLPFCNATNASSYEGVVILYIFTSGKARIFTCVNGSWTDWFDYKLPEKTF
jgi:hypothetical protein